MVIINKQFINILFLINLKCTQMSIDSLFIERYIIDADKLISKYVGLEMRALVTLRY